MSSYATLAELKEHLPDLGDGQDALLQKFLDRAEADIERECQRVFTSSAATRLFDGSGSNRLMVPDLVSVTTLRVKSSTGAAFVNVAAADYFLEPAIREPGWPAQWIEISDVPSGGVRAFGRGKRTAEVTGSWGFAAVPLVIKEVAIELGIRLFRLKGRGGSDEGGGEVGGLQPAGAGVRALPADLARRVTNYRRVSVFA